MATPLATERNVVAPTRWPKTISRALATMLPLLCALAPHALADGSVPAGQPVTDEAELRGILSNHTMTGTLPGFPGTWFEYYCPNGVSIYLFDGDLADGRWQVRDGKTCFSYDPPGHQFSYCYSVYRQDDGGLIFVSKDVSEYFVQTVVAKPSLPGDPLNLRGKSQQGCNRRDQPAA